MGFSAGGHLVSLVASSPAVVQSTPASLRPLPWLGTVALDSAVYDVVSTMNNLYHQSMFDAAFGSDPKVWTAASPTAQMKARMAPFLAGMLVTGGSPVPGRRRSWIRRWATGRMRWCCRRT